MGESLRTRRLGVWLQALALATATAALMVATEPRMAIANDEKISLHRMARVRAWISALREPSRFASTWQPSDLPPLPETRPAPSRDAVSTRAGLMRPSTIHWFWPFGREEPHGHPPFYAIVGLIGDVLTPSWAELPRARLGTMLAFSLTAGAIFLFFAPRFGSLPALVAAGAWVLQPNLFGLAHYANYDALLSSLWVGAILAFAAAVEGDRRNPRWVYVALFGLMAGWAADTKFTGWFLPAPFLAWVLIARERKAILAFLAGGAIGLATLYAFNPPWWSSPIEGVGRLLQSNLTRDRTAAIPVMFLGKIYLTPRVSLPWYNTLAWTVFVTPIGFLALAISGAVGSLGTKRFRPIGCLAFANWASLIALRALPHTPGHDGVRQFVPAFGCVALLAGLGTAWIGVRFRRTSSVVAAVAILEGAAAVAMTYPMPLSYFSPAIGGLPGAVRLGLEPTYYWDALNDDALAWLRENTPPGRTVTFSSNQATWSHLIDTGKLRPVAPFDPNPPAWYVVQNRPGSFSRLDADLIAHARRHVLVERQRVPLVWAFPAEEVAPRMERFGGDGGPAAAPRLDAPRGGRLP